MYSQCQYKYSCDKTNMGSRQVQLHSCIPVRLHTRLTVEVTQDREQIYLTKLHSRLEMKHSKQNQLTRANSRQATKDLLKRQLQKICRNNDDIQMLKGNQLDCNPSQVKAKSNLRLVASLLLHSQWFSFFFFHQL